MEQISPQAAPPSGPQQIVEEGRYRLLFEQLVAWLELPMAILGLVWLVLLVVELGWGLHPLLASLALAIWVVFVLVFMMEFGLAPDRTRYLRKNWLTALALLIPALRVFRLAQAIRVLSSLRAVNGLQLLRIVTSTNRSMRALRRTLARRGLGYVMILTAIIVVIGAAGMYAFEGRNAGSAGFESYGHALWWTIMLISTVGSQHWPQTAEGRILCVLIALYSIGVFGYLTATLASFLVGRDAENEEAEIAGADAVRALQADIAALRAELAAGRESAGESM